MAVLSNMEMPRKSVGRSTPGREGGNGGLLTVGLPLPHEGVGNALRSTFVASDAGLPDDMMALLEKLYRH